MFALWVMGSDVTGSGVQRDAAFSHDELDHGTGLRLVRHLTGHEIKILDVFGFMDSAGLQNLNLSTRKAQGGADGGEGG